MAGMVDVPAEAWNLAEEFGFSTSLPPISENSASYIQPISTGNVASIGPSIEYQEVRLAISTLQLRMDRFETLFENTRKEKEEEDKRLCEEIEMYIEALKEWTSKIKRLAGVLYGKTTTTPKH